MVKKNPPAKAGDIEFDPWVGKMPRRRAWQPTPVFLPGESHEKADRQVTLHRVAKSQTCNKPYKLIAKQ